MTRDTRIRLIVFAVAVVVILAVGRTVDHRTIGVGRETSSLTAASKLTP